MPIGSPQWMYSSGAAYSIDNSCRFDNDSSPNMTRTPSGASNQKTFTLSVWLKLSSGTQATSYYGQIFGARTGSSSTYGLIQMLDDGGGQGVKLHFGDSTGASCKATRLLRDVSAWYHVVYKIDSTESTDTDRVKIYINGEETTLDSPTLPSENQDFTHNSTSAHHIGSQNSTDYFDGYMAEMHFIDGTALTPSSFGEAGDYGEWKAKEVSGLTYGTNGFYLDFADSGDLGDDESGNGNDFTETNITASDQSLDSPTNNFSTLNHLAKALNDTLSEGDLKKTGTSTQSRTLSTFGFDSGKWYFEIYVHTRGSDNPSLGISDAAVLNARNTIHVGDEAGSFGYYSTAAGAANVNHGGTGNNGGTYSVYTNGHIIGVGLNIDDLQVTFYNNGANAVTSGTTYETLTAGMTYNFAVGTNGTGVMIANFGQDGTFAGNVTAGGNADDNGYGNFKYDVPTGFLAACSKNLPSPTVVPSEHFSTNIWSGNSTDDRAITTGFQPDLVWIKCRTSGSNSHHMYDSLRGVGKRIKANATTAEQTYTDTMMAFTSTGFEVDDDASVEEVNKTGKTFVGWSWKGGTSQGSTATSGSGTSKTYTANYNADAGFSIVSYTGNGTAGHTIPHHLSVKPALMLVKGTSATASWTVYADITGMGAEKFMELHNTAAIQDSLVWNDVEPTSSVFTVGSASDTNSNDATYIAYCFHSVENYSKVGTYPGNGSAADATFVYTGFRPKYVLIKATGAYDWTIADSVRYPANPKVQSLFANIPEGEYAVGSAGGLDFLSNGFKPKDAGTGYNYSGWSYLYYAIAETPFKQANAV